MTTTNTIDIARAERAIARTEAHLATLRRDYAHLSPDQFNVLPAVAANTALLARLRAMLAV